MDKPIVIKNVLPEKLFSSLRETLDIQGWNMNNKSHGGDNSSWGLFARNTDITWFEAATIIKLKCKKHIKEKIQLIKIHMNGQTSGQITSFHQDFTEPLSWTFVLFTENDWNSQWGGEFVAFNPHTREYHYTPYIPNSGALIPACWEHYGQSPNMHTDRLRTTIAFSYMELNTLEMKINSDDDMDIIKKFI